MAVAGLRQDHPIDRTVRWLGNQAATPQVLELKVDELLRDPDPIATIGQNLRADPRGMFDRALERRTCAVSETEPR